MSTGRHQERALSRTTRLINQAFFDGRADEKAITVGLLATTARLVADRVNMSTPCGQAALISAFQLIARMGIGIELIVPEVPLLAATPPLRGPTLCTALLDLGHDLIPGATVRGTAVLAHVTFAFGDSPCQDPPDAIHVTATDHRARLARDGGHGAAKLMGEMTVGGLAAGAAAAAIALDVALTNVERVIGASRTTRPRPTPGPPVDIDVADLFPSLSSAQPTPLGKIDVISAGAITNALVATLMRYPGVIADLRVLDDDLSELSNLNRNVQQRASDEGQPKVDVLTRSGTTTLKITGIKRRFPEKNRDWLLPLAERVAVGVDHIPARWWVQQEWPANLYIGATTNYEAIVTTHHPGEPCAGCAHPHPLQLADDQFVPTISYVSFWAGLLQACALVEGVVQRRPARRITVYPHGLGEKRWHRTAELPTGAQCAIDCPASRSA
jgi:ThiF family